MTSLPIETAWLQAGKKAVQTAADILHSANSQLQTTQRIELQGRETKILADTLLHQEISAILQTTGLPVYSEEGNTRTPEPGQWCWVVDPLDGSANFQRGFSLCAVSIALCHGPQPKAGFIYDLHTRQILTGGSSTPCEPRLQCATTDSLDRAILCTGIPARLQWSEENTLLFSNMFRAFYKIRMLGSAVQALLHVATGKADVYFERNTMFWDIAAAWALADAAGVSIITCPGSHPGSLQFLATTPPLLNQCQKLLLPTNLQPATCNLQPQHTPCSSIS